MKRLYTTFVFLIVILLFAFGLFVYPGVYRYAEVKLGDNIYPVRVNVISGYTEMYVPAKGGWYVPKGN